MNIRKFYVYHFFHDLMPIYPIYALLFEMKNMTMVQISLLLAIWSVPVVLLEIPSGVLADRWSRKNMISLGSLMKATCFFVWIFSESFFLFALGFILWGTGSAFYSGSSEALLFDSLKSEGRENGFDKILGRGKFFSGISTMIAAISGGFIGKHLGMKYALSLSVFFAIISAVVAFTYREVNHYHDLCLSSEEKENESTLRDALLFFRRNRKIFIVTLIAVLVIGMAGILDEYDPLIAKNFKLTVDLVGIWVAFRFLFMSCGSYLAYAFRILSGKIFRSNDRICTIGLLCLLASVFLGVAGFIRHIWVMGFYGLYYLIMSATEILQEDYIQQKVDSEGRATVHSIVSMAHNLYGILACSSIGVLLLITDLFGLLVAVAGYGAILATSLWLLSRR